ncbi:immunity 22 family protein [Mycobacterium sp. 21AC1]|uniref:immunity 22 family protein n=1 Tax=[Mycobacterium] appelbergii TaxID=2939269 RepID=UPI0029392437|nr:immunity 22 family protein [Mycobacterium sp. 21AC1]MDV3129455.1 immunity 22 family protein [Mycobacterium sp. 21AC1]
MLDFVELRYRTNPRLRVVSVWIGDTPTRTALDAYISADRPERGGFTADLGEEWLDHDFLEASFYGDPGPVHNMVTALVEDHGLPRAVADEVLNACRDRGLRTANTVVLLRQHTYRESAGSRRGLAFAGTYEYEEPLPQTVLTDRHLFTGITSAPTLADLRSYVLDGSLTTDLADAFTGEASEFEVSAQYYGYRLRDPGDSLPVDEFFALPIVTDRIVLAAGSDVTNRCRQVGLESVNAFISLAADHLRPASVGAERRYAGLRYLGIVNTVM